jgi:membrane protein
MATAGRGRLGNGPKRMGPAARVEARIGRAVARLYVWLARNRMTRFPWAVVQTFSRAQGALLSGSMAYYTFLSLVPLLMVAGFVIGTLARSNPQISSTVSTAMGQLLPGVQGRQVVDQLIGARVAFGILGLLSVAYAGSGFVGSMTACMNRMWEVETGRNPVSQKAFNILIVILLSAVLMGSVGLTIWIGYAARAVFGNEAGPLVRLLSTLASPFSILVLLLLLYRLLPARRHSWLSQVPGALLGAIGVELLKRAFALWTERSAGVGALPRSLLSVVLLLVWLGLFAQLVLYGAALNVVLDRRRHRQPLLPHPPGFGRPGADPPGADPPGDDPPGTNPPGADRPGADPPADLEAGSDREPQRDTV